MKIKDLVRIVVIKTNPCWPFSSLNRLPYYLAIKSFVRLCKKFPEIKSVYLRHGLIQQNWVSGISDIDLTIVIDSKLTVEKEFYFLNSFWKNYDQLKKLFPMLGEIDILNEEHIGSWTKFGMQGYESSNWRLVYGTETVKSNYIVDPKRLAIDSLNYALTCYLGYFLRKFYKQEQPHYITLKELHRLVFKILRYTDYFTIQSSNKYKTEGRFADKTDMLCCILNGLEKRIQHFIPPDNPAALRRDAKDWLNGISQKVAFDDHISDMKELASQYATLEGIFMSYRRNFIVLKNGLSTAVMKDHIDTIRQVFVQKIAMPVIASSCIFEYILRFYDPFLYTNLISYGKIVNGKDLLSEIQSPDMYIFIKKVIEQTTNVLTFPQSRALISPSSRNWILERELESMVERSLFVKLYLEKGIIKPLYSELLDETQKHYPDDYKKLNELKKNTSCSRDGSLIREAFSLLKGIANDIHKSISTSSVVDNLFKIGEGAGK
jgi:hypothetical protein